MHLAAACSASNFPMNALLCSHCKGMIRHGNNRGEKAFLGEQENSAQNLTQLALNSTAEVSIKSQPDEATTATD